MLGISNSLLLKENKGKNCCLYISEKERIMEYIQHDSVNEYDDGIYSQYYIFYDSEFELLCNSN
jgi:hypothetical protein